MSIISQMKADVIKLKVDAAALSEDTFPVGLLVTVFRTHPLLLIILFIIFGFGFLLGNGL